MPGVNRIDRERVKQLLSQGLRQVDVALRLGINRSSVCVIDRERRKEVSK
jgi:transcriptional regulator